MKHLYGLSLLLVTLEWVFSTGKTEVAHSTGEKLFVSNKAADSIPLKDDPTQEWYPSVGKRGGAYKRLPGWAVWYGKRSLDTTTGNTLDNLDNDHTDGQATNSLFEPNKNIWDSNFDKSDSVLNTENHEKLQQLRDWFEAYGKNELEPSETSSLLNSENEDGEDQEYLDMDKIEDNIDKDTLSDTDDIEEKRSPGWNSMYGKRSPGWNAMYGKRVPGWYSAYGKRALIYGKRLPGWRTTYGKRSTDPNSSNSDQDLDNILSVMSGEDNEDTEKRLGWQAMYGKRAPGWYSAYGKRAGWYSSYGKRAPGWYSAYGKRAPGWYSAYGKRAPGWYSAYGKRAPGWYSAYGKRAPGWYSAYGKRALGWYSSYGKRAPGWYSAYGKRARNWQAMYGKRAMNWQALYGKRDSDEDALVSNTVLTDTNNNDVSQTDKRGRYWNSLYGR